MAPLKYPSLDSYFSYPGLKPGVAAFQSISLRFGSFPPMYRISIADPYPDPLLPDPVRNKKYRIF